MKSPISSEICHLCGGGLFPKPALRISGMPKAAQYYPERSEFEIEKGITLEIRQCLRCGLIQHTGKPVDYYKEVITAATLSPKSRSSRLAQMKQLSERFGLLGRKLPLQVPRQSDQYQLGQKRSCLLCLFLQGRVHNR